MVSSKCLISDVQSWIPPLSSYQHDSQSDILCLSAILVGICTLFRCLHRKRFIPLSSQILWKCWIFYLLCQLLYSIMIYLHLPFLYGCLNVPSKSTSHHWRWERYTFASSTLGFLHVSIHSLKDSIFSLMDHLTNQSPTKILKFSITNF